MRPLPTLSTAMSGVGAALEDKPAEDRILVLRRSTIIALIAFLTLIDLFGSQALLPTLVKVYDTTPAAMGFAVNASTLGMAAASLIVAIFARRIDRRKGVWICLALLSIPTALLASADSLATFTALRIAQGVFMAAAFTLTLTYLSEVCAITAIGGAMAAYITGNVASNLVGRLLASGLADNLGLAESFYAFALLNLSGALLAYLYFTPGLRGGMSETSQTSVFAAWRAHLANPALSPMFAIGFLLLFVFVAVFTYANFVLASAPFELPQMLVGLAYLVFAPAILTTPAAAGAARRFGARRAFQGSVLVSGLGLAMLLTPSLPLYLLGLTLIGAGLFFAQSVATGYVGRVATADHAAANGLYLASYYLGGIAGAFVIGQINESLGWAVAVLVLLALTVAIGLLGRRIAA
ncbi:MAG: MFS transporter [Pseudomonadota bacterium]